jgi:hypothetical protein
MDLNSGRRARGVRAIDEKSDHGVKSGKSLYRLNEEGPTLDHKSSKSCYVSWIPVDPTIARRQTQSREVPVPRSKEKL